MAISQSETIEAAEVGAPGLERKVGLAWMALAWEALWPRLVPLLSAVALFVAAAHLDLFAGLDPWLHSGLLAALALGFGGGGGRVADAELGDHGAHHRTDHQIPLVNFFRKPFNL